VFAQDTAAPPAQAAAPTPPARAQRDSRYQIGMMEGVLEKAVEHGAAVIREHMQKVFPADMLLSQPVRVRGIRLDGYGVVFDIDVPTLQSAPLWSLQTLDQNNLGLESAINALRDHVNASGDPSLQQALQRMELAVPLMSVSSAGSAPAVAVRRASGSALAADDTPAARAPEPDPVLANPSEAYHTEIQEALMEAMLDHSRGLAIGANEWLTVVAGGVNSQPLSGLDSDGYTAVISIRGSDLSDFLANRISHEEARQRMQVKLF
jgi:hypothetical protein